MVQGLQDKKYMYFGSNRMFYSGCSINSGATWTYVDFSGTNTGFGPHGNTESQRFAIAASGACHCQFGFNSGTSAFQQGEVYGNEALTFDGINRSGCWIRTDEDSQVIRVWAW